MGIRSAKVGVRVRFKMPIIENDFVDDTGTISRIDGYYIYVTTDKLGIEIERYSNELELI